MKIKDDRGVTHSGGKKFVRSALAIRDFDRMRMVEKRIEQKSKATHLVLEMLCLVLLSVPFLAGAFSLLVDLDLNQKSELIGLCALTVIGVLILLSALFRPRTMKCERRKLMRELEMYKAKFQGVCLICEYNLAGLQPEPDGCVVCPECGGAWKLADRAITRSEESE